MSSSLVAPAVSALLLAASVASHALAASVPTDEERPFTPTATLDRLLVDSLKQHELAPAPLCNDATYIRRVTLDLTGTLPPVAEVRRFLDDSNPDKRARLVDALLTHEQFANYWTLKWCDLLRVKAEYPINLWPNGVQAYARWIHDHLAANTAFDTFARELLTASGSNFRAPAVNVYRAVQGETPGALASAVALTFMGTRLDSWPEQKRTDFETIFSRVSFKGTAEWKETIVFLDPTPAPPLTLTLPDGLTLKVPPGQDPREAFADWLLADENPWFARNIVNRAWSWFFGRGLIHEPDDIRPDNPAVHPKLLQHLERDFIASGYDMHHLLRVLLTSSTYQQSCVPSAASSDAKRLFACYPVRRLDAEVLLDALTDFSGRHDAYSSQIPEPFTFVPRKQRTIELTDGSITSPFLKMFGRPARDTGLESERTRTVTKEQRLHLINSSHIMAKLNRSTAILAGKTMEQKLQTLYLSTLARYPTDEEQAIARDYVRSAGRRAGQQDLIWAIINSKEFLYQH